MSSTPPPTTETVSKPAKSKFPVLELVINETPQVAKPLAAGGFGYIYTLEIGTTTEVIKVYSDKSAAVNASNATPAQLAEYEQLVSNELLSRIDAEFKLRYIKVTSGLGDMAVSEQTKFDADSAYLRMEYVDGTELKDWLKEHPTDVLQIFARLALTIDHQHDKGIYNIDLANNVRITPDGRPVIIDYGKFFIKTETELIIPPGILGTGKLLNSHPILQDNITPQKLTPEMLRRGENYTFTAWFFQLITGLYQFKIGEDDVTISATLMSSPFSIGLAARLGNFVSYQAFSAAIERIGYYKPRDQVEMQWAYQQFKQRLNSKEDGNEQSQIMDNVEFIARLMGSQATLPI